ncbi:hypothetical protein ACS0TY_035312 [Phlomoides rotata]
MESLNQKRSLVEEDANISLFRRSNKIIILVFLFLIISSALIIAALIVELVRIHNSNNQSVLISPITSFCSVSEFPPTCLKAFNPILDNTLIIDPDQILTFSLQASVFQIQNIINSSSIQNNFAFRNCSNTLRHALGQLGGPLAAMRANPFVLTLSHDQREEIRKPIVAAGEDVKSCNDDLGVAAAAEKLVEVEVYLNSGQDFLFRYDRVMRKWGRNFLYRASFQSQTSLIYDHLFEMVMCGLQVLFMFGMFCALFRIR